MTSTQTLSESLEDYLEAIFHIVDQKQAARAKDIALRMNVKSSSVTGALHALSEKGLINYAPYDLITLTPEGKKRAGNVVRRHRALRDFFVKVLSVGEEESEEAACKMEHGVSPNILKRFSEFIGFIERCPRMNIRWTEGRGYQCEHGDFVINCEECMSKCLNDKSVGKDNKECN